MSIPLLLPFRRALVSCYFLLGIFPPTRGEVILYQATGTFTHSDFVTDIAVGDRFTLTFAYDDAVTDINANTLAGRFPGALMQFEFWLLPGAVGTYAPGSASVFSPIDTFDGTGEGAAVIPDRFYLSAAGGNFGPLNGHPFGGLLFVLDDTSHSTSIHDTGTGQTLKSQLGGPLVLQQFKSTLFRLFADGKNGVAEGNITTLERFTLPVVKVSLQSLNKLRLAWPTNQPNYLVEATPTLGIPNWQPLDSSPTVDSSDFSLAVETSSPGCFFRLRYK